VPPTGVSPGPVTVKVVPVIVAESMAPLKVAETGVFTATAVARFAGTVEMTVGGAAVVKVHTKLAAKEMPALSFAPVVIVALYKVLLARTTDGVNVAVDPEYVTAPATGVSPGPVKVNVALLNVSGFIGSVKRAERRVFTGTAAAPAAGTVEIIVGSPVVKLHTKLAAKGLPPGSVAPVVMVATYTVLAASETDGVKVAVEPA